MVVAALVVALLGAVVVAALVVVLLAVGLVDELAGVGVLLSPQATSRLAKNSPNKQKRPANDTDFQDFSNFRTPLSILDFRFWILD